MTKRRRNNLLFDNMYFCTIDSIAQYALENKKEGIVSEMIPGRIGYDIYTISRKDFTKTADELADIISEVYRLGFLNQN